MKRFFIYRKNISNIILIVTVIITAILLYSCEESGYEIKYQDGYPNNLAGNWIAFDYQLNKANYLKVLDTINDFNLSSQSELNRFIDIVELTAVSDKYDLVTALDPDDNNNIIFNNIYNSGLRTKAIFNESKFNTRLGDQLDLLNLSGFTISYVSLSGQLVEDSEGDVLYIIVGLYDKEKALLESLFIVAFRKTGFEDTDYQSLLNK